MADGLLLLAVFGAAFAGFALLALSQARHWNAITATPPPGRARVVVLRGVGGALLGGSLVLALLRDGPSFGSLLWATAISVAALAVALTLAWRPASLRPLRWCGALLARAHARHRKPRADDQSPSEPTMLRGLRPTLLALMLLGLGARAAAEDAVIIELNKLEPTEAGCRIYLVLENRTDSAFETLKLDLVMFDADLVVARRLAVETAPLPADKLSLKVFDIEDLACDRVGRILLNDVLACADGSGGRDDCLGFVATATRSGTAFVK